MKNKAKDRHVQVSLTGGLGNQLFQLTAAVSMEPTKITLLSRFGIPRATEGIPDLWYYKLPSHVKLEPRGSEPLIYRKVVGYLLRMGVEPKKFEKNKFINSLINLLARVIISLRIRKPARISVGQGVGYSPIESNHRSTVLIGYFQTEKYFNSPNVMSQMSEIELKNVPPILAEHRILASVEHPLVVHVRLGDYRSEENFGLLTANYYECLQSLWATNSYGKIWLFSDEPEAALERIPNQLLPFVRVVNDDKENPATTLELMRLGEGYVIANSSLSWWAAKLTKANNPIVVAPLPWFKAMPEPLELIPREWQRREGFN